MKRISLFAGEADFLRRPASSLGRINSAVFCGLWNCTSPHFSCSTPSPSSGKIQCFAAGKPAFLNGQVQRFSQRMRARLQVLFLDLICNKRVRWKSFFPCSAGTHPSFPQGFFVCFSRSAFFEPRACKQSIETAARHLPACLAGTRWSMFCTSSSVS